MGKLAVVLFNLGGPDLHTNVRPFLFNLFNDPAIVGAPGPVRWALAQYISRKRAPVAREIYTHIGGSSPLLKHTQSQARGLKNLLLERGLEARVFIAMRYWHPMTAECVAEVKAWGPDEVVLLPLYPQFSSTTTGSSLKAWRMEAMGQGLDVQTRAVCCYPILDGFVRAQARLINETLRARSETPPYRLLFSAHGLPERIVRRGDPYCEQIARSARAVVRVLEETGTKVADWRLSYQSRVGKLKWVEPYTEDEIARAGRDGKALLVVPIAFVSEHSETLVELDIEYRELAEKAGVPAYWRASTVLDAPEYLAGLADMVAAARARNDEDPVPGDGGPACGGGFPHCPLQQIQEHAA